MFLLKLVNALKKSRLRYAIAGGYAVALHGAVRGTVDIDLVIQHKERDFIKVADTLKKLGLASRLPISAKEVFQFKEEYKEKRNLLAWSFVNSNNPTELVDVLLTDDLNTLKTKSIYLEGHPVSIVSKPSLIKMKQRSGRAQDIEDIRALKKI